MDKDKAFASYFVSEADRNAVEIGVVKFFDATKKFGFVEPVDPDKTAVFIPGAMLTRAGIRVLYQGDRIEHERITDKYGRADAGIRIRLLVKQEEAAE
jgi:cold shock CspA family protein